MENEEKKTPKVTIDGTEYEFDSLSSNAKKLLNMMRVADGEIKHLELQLNLARIAQQTLGNSLKTDLAAPKEEQEKTEEAPKTEEAS
jgi:hypothetical protein